MKIPRNTNVTLNIVIILMFRKNVSWKRVKALNLLPRCLTHKKSFIFILNNIVRLYSNIVIFLNLFCM